MNFPRLDDRLKSVADFIPPCKVFLDVGTDHAFLPVYLLKNKITEFAIASDLRKGPLDSAKKTALHFCVTDKISLRLGSGFETVRESEVQAAAVAGMGGILISELLKASENIVRKIETIVLQPMTAAYELRVFLYQNGYTVADEVLAKDGNKIYTVMKVHPHAQKKNEPLSEAELYIGRHILKKDGEIYREFKQRQLDKLKKQILGMEKSLSGESLKRLSEIKKLYEDIKKLTA